MIQWLNGAFLDESKALLAANSSGILLGWGVFTTLGVRDGQAIAIDRHCARLRQNAAALSIEFAFEDEVLCDALREVIARNAVQNGIARLTLTNRGDGRWNLDEGSDCSIIAFNVPAPPLNDLRLILSPFRLDTRRALAGIKSTSYMEHQLAWIRAQQQDGDEALLCNHSGAICEGARSNIFWARGGELFTPSLETGCLPGIARGILLEAAANLGIAAREGVFSLSELSGADEIFLSSASSGPRSVASFQIADEPQIFPSPGAVTQTLQHWWQQNALAL